MAERDTQSRKWQLTINNPVPKGFTHDRIKEIVGGMKSVIYWCMADEIGEEGTPHTHVYLHGRGGIRFSTLKKNFDGAHFEMAKGTAAQNMEYVSKTGKWADTKKKETSLPGTFEEFGEMPIERQGRRNDLDDLYCMIKDGYSNFQILEAMPESILNIDKLDKIRQTIIQERFKDICRELEVYYIWGDTGTGKTRSIMEQYGFSNVYRVTDYAHPFDNYHEQDVMVFEEFRSGFTIREMLNYLDIYPLELPCRYANKFACYTKVFIVSNIPLDKQFPNVQYEEPATWLAFLRRIKAVIHFKPYSRTSEKIEIYPSGFYKLMECDTTPFSNYSG